MITANPFGVGASGESRRTRDGRCACCGLAYQYEWWPGAPPQPNCTHCLEHAQGSDDSRTLARLRDHEPRILAYAKHAAKRATEYEAQAKQAKADGAAQAASAFRQRDRLQQLLAGVYNIHADVKGQCKACKSRYPCSTVKLLEGGRDGDAIIRAASRRDDYPDLFEE